MEQETFYNVLQYNMIVVITIKKKKIPRRKRLK